MVDAQDNTVIRTFKYRLLPTKKQHTVLAEILESQRVLYNAAKQEREDCYRKTGKGRTFFDQCKALTELRKDREYAGLPVHLQRWTLKRLDRAFADFFNRLGGGERAGYPRFRGKGRWHSFGFDEFHSIRFDGKRIRFKGLPGGLRVHIHRGLPRGVPLCCVFALDAKGWHISLKCRVPTMMFVKTGREIGIDVGLKELCVLSTGEAIPNIRIAKRIERELRRKLRAVSRCKVASNGRVKRQLAVARCHAYVTEARNTYLHQVAARLVREYDVIAVEALNFKGMNSGMLAKSFHDASLGRLRQFLAYKAEGAGKRVEKKDPKGSSKECSSCGAIVPKTLKQRWHSCPHCGLELDRDHNAAINILHRAVLRPGARKTRQWPVSAPGNLKTSARAS